MNSLGSAPKAHEETPVLTSELKTGRKTWEEKSGFWLNVLLMGLLLLDILIGFGVIGTGGDELRQEISLLKAEMTTVREMLNFSTNSSAPPTNLMTTTMMSTAPPTYLSTPRFYFWSEFKGFFFEPSEGWESGCVNLPPLMEEKSESVDLGGHCLFLCSGTDCSRMKTVFTRTSFGKECIELGPNSPGVNNLTEIGYDNKISSFRLCKEK